MSASSLVRESRARSKRPVSTVYCECGSFARLGRRLLGGAALVALLAVVAAGCNKTEDKKEAKAIQLVVVKPIDYRQYTQSVDHPAAGVYFANYPVTDYQDFTGRLDAYRTVDIKARASGYLVSVPFKEGDIVHEGDLLFLIDQRPYKAALDAAKASVEVQKANIELAKKTVERDIEARLRSPDSVSGLQIDQDQAQQKQSQANLDLARANLETAQINYDFTTVRSPITGRISRRYVDPWNLVVTDSTMLTEVVTINPVYAYFDVDERTYLDLQKRQTPHVLMRLANEDKFLHTGGVDFIDNKVNGNAGTIRMRGVFDCVEGMNDVVAATGILAPNAPAVMAKLPAILTPGLFCRVRVPVGDPYTAVLVPDAALQTDQGRKFVYVVTPKKDADGKTVYKKDKDGNPLAEPVYQVEYRQVETGLQIGEFRVIKKGLATTAGEEFVVTKGQQRVRLNAQEKQEVEIKVDDTKYQKPESPVAGGQ